MRYTTCIDITEITLVWHNHNVARVYYFLAMKCGYHDEDRDIIRISIRNLAAQLSLTVSATRHALRILIKTGLISHHGDAWLVMKWLPASTPTPRENKPARAPQIVQSDDDYERNKQQLEMERHKVMVKLKKNQLEYWLNELRNGVSKRHNGVVISADEDGINYIMSYLNRINEQ